MERLRLPGTIDSLRAITDYVAAAAAEAGLDEQAAYGLRLAVDEIATNAVVHGYQKTGQSGDLQISADLTPDRLTIVLEDTSPPYDPREAPPPDDLDKAPEQRPTGGLGIYLALQGVDAFRHEYVNNSINRHIFMMNRKQR